MLDCARRPNIHWTVSTTMETMSREMCAGPPGSSSPITDAAIDLLKPGEKQIPSRNGPMTRDVALAVIRLKEDSLTGSLVQMRSEYQSRQGIGGQVGLRQPSLSWPRQPVRGIGHVCHFYVFLDMGVHLETTFVLNLC